MMDASALKSFRIKEENRSASSKAVIVEAVERYLIIFIKQSITTNIAS
jgi:hypothetical protein